MQRTNLFRQRVDAGQNPIDQRRRMRRRERRNRDHGVRAPLCDHRADTCRVPGEVDQHVGIESGQCARGVDVRRRRQRNGPRTARVGDQPELFRFSRDRDDDIEVIARKSEQHARGVDRCGILARRGDQRDHAQPAPAVRSGHNSGNAAPKCCAQILEWS